MGKVQNTCEIDISACELSLASVMLWLWPEGSKRYTLVPTTPIVPGADTVDAPERFRIVDEKCVWSHSYNRAISSLRLDEDAMHLT